MTFKQVLLNYPQLAEYTHNMPVDIKNNFFIKKYPSKSIIHQKNDEIKNFGIVLEGRHRVVNEFENGNIFLIEKNKAISFIGEVALLSKNKKSSVTIETITDCTVFYIKAEKFEYWVQKDANFMYLLSKSIAEKLYSSSYIQGERQYYSVKYIVMKYLIEKTKNKIKNGSASVVIKNTRQEICEEIGLTVKTFNRTVAALKEDNMIDVIKGKITITPSHFDKIQNAIKKHVNNGKRS